MLGHMAHLGKTLQPLKHPLNLPTQTIRLENVRRQTASGGREYHHVPGKFERFLPGGHSLPAGLQLQAPMSPPNGAGALSHCTQSTRNRQPLPMRDDPPHFPTGPALDKVRNR